MENTLTGYLFFYLSRLCSVLSTTPEYKVQSLNKCRETIIIEPEHAKHLSPQTMDDMATLSLLIFPGWYGFYPPPKPQFDNKNRRKKKIRESISPGFCLKLTISPVSALGRRVTVLPSTSRFWHILPSTSSLKKEEKNIKINFILHNEHEKNQY